MLPSGPLGSGAMPSSDTSAIQGTPASASAPSLDDVLAYDGTEYAPTQSPTGGVLLDGIDGAVTLPAGQIAQGYRAETIAVTVGATAEDCFWPLVARTTITVPATSKMAINGRAAAGAVGGNAPGGPYLGYGTNGGNGTAAAGNTGTDLTTPPELLAGGLGGAGGLGSGGGGGAGGTGDTFVAQIGWDPFADPIYGRTVVGSGMTASGGTGGGGGGGNGAQSGGGGGAGADTAYLACLDLYLEGALEAKGGAGAAGLAANCGGGGGGGGGRRTICVRRIHRGATTYSAATHTPAAAIAALIADGAIDVSGGAPGASGGGTGVAGTAGADGVVILIWI